MIRAVNLAISNACSANCLFCPKDRGAACGTKIMKMETFHRIIDNLSDEAFTKDNAVRVFRVGENGDCFLNKNVLEMLRLIRRSFPDAIIELYNHFHMVDEACSDTILREALVDVVFTNIDGLYRSYELAKEVSFEDTLRHLSYFVRRRGELGLDIPVHVRSLTVRQYVETIRANFQIEPTHASREALSLPDDFEDVRRLLQGIVVGEHDSVTRSWVFLWAEREALKDVAIQDSQFWCPQLVRSKRELFVSPEGKAYFCCFDSRQELVIGDLTTTGVCDILAGSERNMLIAMLSNRQFSKIGGPCKTVHCCQIYHSSPLVSHLIRICTRFLALADWSTWRIRFLR